MSISINKTKKYLKDKVLIHSPDEYLYQMNESNHSYHIHSPDKHPYQMNESNHSYHIHSPDEHPYQMNKSNHSYHIHSPNDCQAFLQDQNNGNKYIYILHYLLFK